MNDAEGEHLNPALDVAGNLQSLPTPPPHLLRTPEWSRHRGGFLRNRGGSRPRIRSIRHVLCGPKESSLHLPPPAPTSQCYSPKANCPIPPQPWDPHWRRSPKALEGGGGRWSGWAATGAAGSCLRTANGLRSVSLTPGVGESAALFLQNHRSLEPDQIDAEVGLGYF